MTLDATLEAVLFALAQPVTVKRLCQLCGTEVKEVEDALTVLAQRLERGAGGIGLVRHGQEVELVTHAEAAEIVREALKTEAQSELTRPSLEALAVLAYRGPMTRPELEQIRGIQSSLILRNLMLRGLVELREDQRLGQPVYQVTLDFLKYLGVSGLAELPEYDQLRAHPAVAQVLRELEPDTATAAAESTSITL